MKLEELVRYIVSRVLEWTYSSGLRQGSTEYEFSTPVEERESAYKKLKPDISYKRLKRKTVLST